VLRTAFPWQFFGSVTVQTLGRSTSDDPERVRGLEMVFSSVLGCLIVFFLNLPGLLCFSLARGALSLVAVAFGKSA